jgi:hypothetical protein
MVGDERMLIEEPQTRRSMSGLLAALLALSVLAAAIVIMGAT